MSNQERRLMRRMGGGHPVTASGLYLPQGAHTPQDEQDAKRDRLAERLLEIGLEDTRIGDFTDCHKREPVVDEAGDQKYVEDAPVLTVEQWFVKLANASMSAAEVIYPELPESPPTVFTPASRQAMEEMVAFACTPAGQRATGEALVAAVAKEQDLPAAAQEGAQSVGGWPSEPSPASKPSIEQEGHARALIAQADRGEG